MRQVVENPARASLQRVIQVFLVYLEYILIALNNIGITLLFARCRLDLSSTKNTTCALKSCTRQFTTMVNVMLLYICMYQIARADIIHTDI